jgi:hypothetical protein
MMHAWFKAPDLLYDAASCAMFLLFCLLLQAW